MSEKMDKDLMVEIAMATKTILINILNIASNKLDLQMDANPFDLGLDSMSIIDFILAIEDEFGIGFDEDELSEENFGSINRIVDIIYGKKAAN